MPLLRRVARVAAPGAVAGGAAEPFSIVTGPLGQTRRKPEVRPGTSSRQPPRRPRRKRTLWRTQGLGQLHESGVLTDEEFGTAKAKILA